MFTFSTWVASSLFKVALFKTHVNPLASQPGQQWANCCFPRLVIYRMDTPTQIHVYLCTSTYSHVHLDVQLHACILKSILIMSYRQHGYPWPSLATSPYHSSPPAGLLGYIPCPHIAAVCKFWLVVLLLLGHMWGSIGERHLRARPCFSGVSGSSNLYSFRNGRQVAVQLASRGVLSPGLVQYCSQHSCVVAVKFLLQPFS